LLAALLLPNGASAWSLNLIKQDKGNVLLGFVGGIAAHELGHISLATLKDTDVEFDRLSITYPDPNLSDQDLLELSSVGFQIQWIASELAFRYLADENTPARIRNRAAGVVLSHLAITAAYMVFLKNDRNGDIDGMSRVTGISNDRLLLAVSVPAVLDGWRLLGHAVPKWVPTASIMSKGIGITWVWTY